MKQTRHNSTVGFRVIGTMKLVSGAFMFAAGIGIFRILHSDLADLLEHYATRLHLDPDNRLVHFVLTRVGGISPERLKLIVAGTFLYAIVHFIEGFGLIFLQRWAEYLTVILTSSLMPLEIYEIFEKVSPIRISVFVVNLAIVIYLIFKLQQEHRFRKEEAKGSAAPG